MNQIESFRFNERLASIASHILLVLMMTFTGVGIIQMGSYLLLGWNTTGLIVVCILISIEAILSLRIFKNQSDYFWNLVGYYLIEWVVIAILLKVFTEIRYGLPYFWGNLLNWPNHFVEAFFTNEYIVNTLFTFVIWIFTSLFARNLADLEGDVLLLRSPDLAIDRRIIHKKITNRFLWIGVFLVLFAGVMRQDRFTITNNLVTSSVNVSFVFYYFLLGLILLSLTNFASLRASWSLEHATIQKNLAIRWIFSSIIFLAILTIVAVILPTHYSIGFLDALAYVLNLVIYILQLVFAVIATIFAFIGSVLQALINFIIGKHQQNLPSSQNQMQEFFPRCSQQINPIPFWEVLRTLIFWIILAGILVYTFSQYLQRNREFIQKLGNKKVLKWVAELFEWLRGFWKHGQQNVRAVIRSGLRRLRIRRSARKTKIEWNFINLRRLSARQKVLFYYHALLRRADETGLPRRPWMTPYEYSTTLEKVIAEQGDNINSMTEGFIEARYSQHRVAEALASQIKTSWNQLRNFLRSWQGKTKQK